MSETIRVLLADDDVIVREGLADLLNQQDGIDVVAVAENGSEALRELSKQTVDVALLDVDMPVLDSTVWRPRRKWRDCVPRSLWSCSLCSSMRNRWPDRWP